tara:strand:+ start:5955 stop:6899 length:945 start_codon:yes stop_codon:yes gene_type:complete
MKNAFLPQLLPGEHVLSMFSRRLRLNAWRSIEDEQLAFTGRKEALGIQTLANSTLLSVLNCISDADEQERVLREHTLCGFYSHSMKQKWIRSFLSSIKRKQHKDLFVPHCSKLRSSNSWRWCNDCIDEDRTKFGVAYWHVEHQVPTSIICSKHTTKRLISGCEHCGFVIRDLKQVSGPNAKCPQCRADIMQPCKPITDTLKWIHRRGLELHRDVSSLLNPAYAYDMNYALALYVSRLEGCKNWEYWRVHEKYQPKFSEWAQNMEVDILFHDQFSFQDDFAVSLSATLTKNRKVSPMSHLLWLRFFGVKSFLEVV